MNEYRPYLRNPGYMCGRSQRFYTELIEKGWPDRITDSFNRGIVAFENGCLTMDWNEAMTAFPSAMPKEFYPFLEELAPHIRVLQQSDCTIAMQSIAANGNHPDFMKAQKWFLDAEKKERNKK